MVGTDEQKRSCTVYYELKFVRSKKIYYKKLIVAFAAVSYDIYSVYFSCGPAFFYIPLLTTTLKLELLWVKL